MKAADDFGRGFGGLREMLILTTFATEHPRVFAQVALKTMGPSLFLPLLDLEDVGLAEESVKKSWAKLAADRKQQVKASGEEVSNLRVILGVGGFLDAGRWLGIMHGLGNRSIRDRLKKSRRRGSAPRGNGTAVLMVMDWLPLGLWLFDDAAAAYMFEVAHGIRVNPDAFGRQRRRLGLYSRKRNAVGVTYVSEHLGSGGRLKVSQSLIDEVLSVERSAGWGDKFVRLLS